MDRGTSLIDKFYWWYVKHSLNYETFIKKSEVFEDPKWQLFSYMGAFCNNQFRLDILRKADLIEKLNIGTNLDRLNEREADYIMHIKSQYRTLARLFVFGFYYESLGSCRTIMELLIRRTVDTKLTERLYLKKTWDELGWDVDDIEKAKKLYDSLCEPVHGKFPKVWEQSKQYSLNNQKFDEFDEELRENLSIIFSQDWINKSLLHLHGIEGLEVYSFTKINETIQLVNYIVKKYPLSVNPK